jgi:hypothetical protein
MATADILSFSSPPTQTGAEFCMQSAASGDGTGEGVIRKIDERRRRVLPRIHILTQYLWPDSAPCGIYAESLADHLGEAGLDTLLLCSSGNYRKTARPAPATPIISLASYPPRRGSFLSTLGGYASVSTVFEEYIRRDVRQGDIAIVTSAPPLAVRLHQAIHDQGASAIYWLQDYYPELVRGIWDYPSFVRALIGRRWHQHLACWDRVVKCAGNLDYHGPNATVIRNWPTLSFPETSAPEPNTALYTGNFGYGHDVRTFVAECKKLRDRGYRITVRGDGPGIAKLPDWIDAGPSYPTAAELHRQLLRHEVHLVAAHPKIRKAIFPSKIWNSLAAGREVIGTGFVGEMAVELEATLKSPFREHVGQWSQLVTEMMPRPA